MQEIGIEVLDKDGNVIHTDAEGATVGEETALENYLSAYKMIYTARINACNSIISEYVKIMKAHVNMYSKNTKEQPTNQQSKQANNQQSAPNGAPNPAPA